MSKKERKKPEKDKNAKGEKAAHLAALNAGGSVLREFLEFLKEYKVIGLAIGFVMGAAATDLVKSIVSNLIMPLVTPFIPGGQWPGRCI
jgi:hypothetical protein